MKSMTCKELGGACSTVFKGTSFEDIVKQSKAHGKEMFLKKDPAHLEAMSVMQDLMKELQPCKNGLSKKKQEFEAL
ncbi:MAG: DUF1059 domain-containing protein [Flavobacteriaceae bacterium]|jgi:hypothetical protein|nr:DUF1059 domain-containing protein [Flavobacteriaceae bacterium]